VAILAKFLFAVEVKLDSSASLSRLMAMADLELGIGFRFVMFHFLLELCIEVRSVWIVDFSDNLACVEFLTLCLRGG